MTASRHLVLVVAMLITVSSCGAGPTARDPRSVATAVSGSAQAPTSSSGRPPGELQLSVSGNRLVGADGRTVRLLGVNRSGTQYACADGPGVFDGPTGATAIAAMTSWAITAVRISLNEHCWLGVNGLPAAYPSTAYRSAIVDYVDRLTAAGLAVILDLHWNAAGSTPARGQEPMADRDHAPRFWKSVAATFLTNRAVLFDLYNEPYPDDDSDSDAAWRCVRDGGVCPGVGFVAAGMQELVNAVRSTGAMNPILVAGPRFAGVLDRWVSYRPDDPIRQLVASIHVYGPEPNASPCWRQECWDSVIGPLARQVPVVISEMGNTDCTGTVVNRLMTWADANQVSYLAWSWVTSSCAAEPALIVDYDGSPTAYGRAVRDHLRGL